MEISRKNIIVMLMTILLVLVIQLIRLDLVLSLNTLENLPLYEYHQEEAESLSESEMAALKKPGVLVVYDQNKTDELQNIKIVLQNMQFDQDAMPAWDKRDHYDVYDLVILLQQDIGCVADIDEIIEYSKAGGHLLYLGNGGSTRQDILLVHTGLFGINTWRERGPAGGIRFFTEILSGLTGDIAFSIGNEVLPDIICPLQVTLSEDCLVHASDERGNPIIWERSGDQNVMVLNTGSYGDKRVRGLLTGAISVFLDTVIYPVTGSAVFQIVNMPVDERLESGILETNYSRNFSQFILDVWWPDMSGFMKRYGLKYTLAYLSSFDDPAESPFEIKSTHESNMGNLSRTILRNDGEISFQGYNQNPLQVARAGISSESQDLWPDIDVMGGAIQQSLDFLKQLMPNYQVRTYIPPCSQLDEEAIDILRLNMPDLNIISSAYFDRTLTDGNAAGDIWIQEFSVAEKYGTAFPHVTAGCFPADGIWFDMASAITTNGIINHVIPADEILGTAGALGLSWEELYEEYKALFIMVDETYGWLSRDTVSTAGEKLKQAANLDLFSAVEDRTIYIACGNFDREACLVIVTEKTITKSKGCDFERIDSIRYLVTMHEKTAVLEVD